MIRIALFASGSGTNVENIARYFTQHPSITIAKVFTNKKDAFVLERARKLGLPSRVFNRTEFYESDAVVNELIRDKIDWVVLAGFLWLIPVNLIKSFEKRIINIHPALLPKYGGKGMYGDKVHESVVNNGEKESGISIHFVNEEYDKGSLIFQAKTSISPNDSAIDVANKVHALEYEHFPKVIEKLVLG